MVSLNSIYSCLPAISAGVIFFASCSHAGELRLPDDRPDLDRDKLVACGLSVIESRHLVLVTDVPVAQVKEIPMLADALFHDLEQVLGPVPPDLAGKDFQVTGYLIDARERFEKAGVLPPEAFEFRHGRHLGYQFWMNNQTAPYYRRHLLLHEFVHCFMMCEHGMQKIPPLWYTEGIAEYFATHQIVEDVARSRFGILPDSVSGFEGWGGVNVIRRALRDPSLRSTTSANDLSLENLRYPVDGSFTDDLRYAQAWALNWLLRNHPELRMHAVKLNRVRSAAEYVDFERSLPEEDWQRLSVLWPLFLDSIVEGFDNDRSFPPLRVNLTAWSDNPIRPFKLSVDAARGWQPSGFNFADGQVVTLKCSGRYSVHDSPKPWISEPQGITIDYVHGRPLGEVHAMIVANSGVTFPRRIPVGKQVSIRFEEESELWLQINDSAAHRRGNSGTAEVVIE